MYSGKTGGLDALIAFWNEHRNEIVTTLVAMAGIHLITNFGGFVKRVGGAKRVEGTGFKEGKDGT